MGTLVSVAPELLDLARTTLPASHREAAGSDYLEALRAEGVKLGLQKAKVFAGDILWALSSAPGDPQLPAGLRFANVDLEQLNTELALGRFENGAGIAGISGREVRNRYGVSVVDNAGEIVALAGVFDTYGLSEIGVDVVEPARGRGLGKAVVSAAVLEILRRDETPLYGCSRTNIRSQRTALSAGFLPVCAEGAVA
jgi:GNAT superfamily N-acetyltransferase